MTTIGDNLKELEAIRDGYKAKIAALDYAIDTIKSIIGEPAQEPPEIRQQEIPPKIAAEVNAAMQDQLRKRKGMNAYVPPQDGGGIRTDI